MVLIGDGSIAIYRYRYRYRCCAVGWELLFSATLHKFLDVLFTPRPRETAKLSSREPIHGKGGKLTET